MPMTPLTAEEKEKKRKALNAKQSKRWRAMTEEQKTAKKEYEKYNLFLRNNTYEEAIMFVVKKLEMPEANAEQISKLTDTLKKAGNQYKTYKNANPNEVFTINFDFLDWIDDGNVYRAIQYLKGWLLNRSQAEKDAVKLRKRVQDFKTYNKDKNQKNAKNKGFNNITEYNKYNTLLRNNTYEEAIMFVVKKREMSEANAEQRSKLTDTLKKAGNKYKTYKNANPNEVFTINFDFLDWIDDGNVYRAIQYLKGWLLNRSQAEKDAVKLSKRVQDFKTYNKDKDQKTAKNKGFNNITEYNKDKNQKTAKNKGFNNITEYDKYYRLLRNNTYEEAIMFVVEILVVKKREMSEANTEQISKLTDALKKAGNKYKTYKNANPNEVFTINFDFLEWIDGNVDRAIQYLKGWLLDRSQAEKDAVKLRKRVQDFKTYDKDHHQKTAKNKGFNNITECNKYYRLLRNNTYEEAIMFVVEILVVKKREMSEANTEQISKLTDTLKKAGNQYHEYLVKTGQQNVDPIGSIFPMSKDIESIIRDINLLLNINISNVYSPKASTSTHTSLDSLEQDSQILPEMQSFFHSNNIDIEPIPVPYETININELPEPTSENVENYLDDDVCSKIQTMFIPEVRPSTKTSFVALSPCSYTASADYFQEIQTPNIDIIYENLCDVSDTLTNKWNDLSELINSDLTLSINNASTEQSIDRWVSSTLSTKLGNTEKLNYPAPEQGSFVSKYTDSNMEIDSVSPEPNSFFPNLSPIQDSFHSNDIDIESIAMFYETINQNALRPLTSNVALGNYYNINELLEPTSENVENYLDDDVCSKIQTAVVPDANTSAETSFPSTSPSYFTSYANNLQQSDPCIQIPQDKTLSADAQELQISIMGCTSSDISSAPSSLRDASVTSALINKWKASPEQGVIWR